jgi:hypothetical protein
MGTVANVISGPAKLWYAAAGTALPASLDTDADGILADSVWTTATYTEAPFTVDGATIELSTDNFKHMVNECLGPIGATIQAIEGRITLELAESSTTAQLIANPNGKNTTVAAGASQVGKTEFSLDMTDNSPAFYTFVIATLTGAGKSDIWIAPKVAANGTVGTPFRKGAIRVLPITFDIYEDPDAADTQNRFFQRHYITANPTS